MNEATTMVTILVIGVVTSVLGIRYQMSVEEKRGDPCTAVTKAIETLKKLGQWNKDDVLTPMKSNEAEKALTTIFVFLKLTKTMNSLALECDEILKKWAPERR